MAFTDARAAVAALAEGTATLADLREIVVSFPELRSVVAVYKDTDDGLLSWLRDLHDPMVDAQLARRGVAGVGAIPLTPTVTPAPVTPSPQAQAPVASVPVTPIYTPQEVAERPQRRLVLPVTLAVVAALVVVGGGIGGAFALGLIGGPGANPAASATPAGTRPTRSPSTVGTATASPSPQVSTSPSATASATAAAGYTCWDATTVTSLNECQPPTTEAYLSYLYYVYPTLNTDPNCRAADSTGKAGYTGVTVMFNCELGDAMVRYRYWEQKEDADLHFGRKFNAKSTLKSYDILIGGESVGGWVKTDRDKTKGPRGNKRVVMTMWLPAQHLSLSVEGDNAKAMWATFRSARIRPVAQALGHPSREEPGEAQMTTKAR